MKSINKKKELGLKETKTEIEIRKDREFFKKYDDKKVTIDYSRDVDFVKTAVKIVEGRIVKKEKSYYFLPKGNQNRAFRVTRGIFAGFQGTIVIHKIKEGAWMNNG